MSITKGITTTMNHLRTVRLAMLTGTVVVTAVVLAACGSSSNTTSTSASAASGSNAAAGGSGSAARSKFVACLKSHGITLPNRPAGQRPGGTGQGAPPAGGGQGGSPPYGGGGFFFGGGGSAAGGPSGAARARSNNPKFRAALQACGGGRFTQRRFTPNKAAVTKFVACVKAHGYNLPAPNFSGKGSIFPATIARDKKFQVAARACASDLRPQGAGAPGAPPGGASGGGSGAGSRSD
jgi:hypothetical protein